jgi:hypothetical protein
VCAGAIYPYSSQIYGRKKVAHRLPETSDFFVVSLTKFSKKIQAPTLESVVIKLAA